MRPRSRLEPGRLLARSPAGRLVAGPGVDDALRVAARLAAEGFRVGLAHRAADPADDPAEFSALVELVGQAGPVDGVDLRLDADRLGPASIRELAATAERAGLGVVLSGAAGPLADELPSATVVVRAGEPAAEERCRALAGRAVRLAEGRGAAADLAFVRCLNVLLAGSGALGVATADRRLIAIAGERAAWYGRPPESWEHVMPYGVRVPEQRRLVAAGSPVRVLVPSGAGALAVVVRELGSRS